MCRVSSSEHLLGHCEPGESRSQEPGDRRSQEPGERRSQEPGERRSQEPGESRSQEPGERRRPGFQGREGGQVFLCVGDDTLIPRV